MEEKKQVNVRLSTAILIIIIVALIGGIVYFVYQNNVLKNKQAQSETELKDLQSKTTQELQDLQNKTQELQKTSDSAKNNITNTTNSSNINTNNKSNVNYSNKESDINVEWNGTEANYVKYNSNGYHVKIEEFKESDLGKDEIEIITQIYKEKSLPYITQQQYKKLENGKTVEISGLSMKKSKSYKGKHDLGIYHPTETEDHGPFYFVDKNSDGMGKLSYADIIDCTPTNEWMHFFVSKNGQYKNGKKTENLKEHLHEYLGANKVDVGLLAVKRYEHGVGVDDYQLIFKNGKCIGIELPDIEHIEED